MRIRHLVAADNVDAQGFVIDPLLVRHGIVLGGQIADLAGPIDARTHLNLDFAEHRLDDCLVAERTERGAELPRDGDRFRVAFGPAGRACTARASGCGWPARRLAARGEWPAEVERLLTR